jgi:hypothetical protein
VVSVSWDQDGRTKSGPLRFSTCRMGL